MFRLGYLLLTWLLASVFLFFVWSIGPSVNDGQRPIFPRNLDQLRTLVDDLDEYRTSHFTYTLCLFGVAYLYKQTFAIPGSFFMNLLAGALFGLSWGLTLVCSLTAVGATLCFLLSFFFARPLVERCFAAKILQLQTRLNDERDRLFMFLLSARVFPFTPHWLLNICSPFLDIPITTHASSVAIGLIPYNVLCVRAGCVLSEVRSTSDVFDVVTLLELFLLALAFFAVAKYSKRATKTESPALRSPILSHKAVD